MQASLDLVLPYTHIRKQFGTPIAYNQLIQGKLADMYTKLGITRLHLRHSTADRQQRILTGFENPHSGLRGRYSVRCGESHGVFS